MHIIIRKITIWLAFLMLVFIKFDRVEAQQPSKRAFDICIYGATSAGVIAAYTAKQLGKSVILVESSSHIGGMTSGGLGYTDIGNKYVVTGMAIDFYRRVGRHYGGFEQWTFEPKVAKAIFETYLQKADVPVIFKRRLIAVEKSGTTITSIIVEDVMDADNSSNASELKISAKEFLDCTYEGDLMARAGVSFTVGREPNTQYKETYNGVHLLKGHQFPDGIDPYITPGDSTSGLLWGIGDGKLMPEGSGDEKVQAYNIRICLTANPDNMIPITRPDGYDSTHYALFLRWIEKYPAKSINSFFIISKMPNDKTDINNRGPFSTDMIGMNWNYPEADYDTRRKIQDAHDVYTKGFLYFVGHDSRVPKHLRDQMLKYGYPKDEYIDNDHWTPQMYVRESRRMVGEYVVTQANCEGRTRSEDGIAQAAYTMDSHNCDRIVVDGMVKNEGNVEIGGFGPFPISYKALVPKPGECTNLLVPVCLSASHIAYGSIRMEPVFMVLGQAAATAAVLAIDQQENVQDVPVEAIRRLLKENPYVDGRPADILVDNEDSSHVIIQGDWKEGKRGGYGPNFLSAKAGIQKETPSVRFVPEVSVDGVYNLYAYYPKLKTIADKTLITIFDGRKKVQRTINKSDVQVGGQTSGEWVSLGKFKLKKGKSAYVEISNDSQQGLVVADAVLCVRNQ